MLCERLPHVPGYTAVKLVCEREPTNVTFRYSVAFIKDGIVTGHLPRKDFKVCYLFILKRWLHFMHCEWR